LNIGSAHLRTPTRGIDVGTKAEVHRLLSELATQGVAVLNPHWGYKRIVGELKGVGVSVSATSVRKVLLEAGLQTVASLL
jgi:hypothetical protein